MTIRRGVIRFHACMLDIVAEMILRTYNSHLTILSIEEEPDFLLCQYDILPK